jgi:hypothetical protein
VSNEGALRRLVASERLRARLGQQLLSLLRARARAQNEQGGHPLRARKDAAGQLRKLQFQREGGCQMSEWVIIRTNCESYVAWADTREDALRAFFYAGYSDAWRILRVPPNPKRIKGQPERKRNEAAA